MNCKEEFLEHTAAEGKEILCAIIEFFNDGKIKKKAYLPIDFDENFLNKFLDRIDFNYDYRKLEDVKGTIWYKDGSYSERYIDNCYGYQYWIHRVLPKIPKELM